MPVPGPPTSIGDIVAEFGGDGALSHYYAGGPYVPSGTSGDFGPIPTSGNLSISQFQGASNFLQQITMGVGSSGGPFPLRGYSSPSSANFGSVSDTSFFDGGSFQEFWWNTSNNNVALVIDTTGIPQGAFTTLNINGNNYASAAASFTDDGSTCTWTWVSGNPFGTSGSILCTFR